MRCTSCGCDDQHACMTGDLHPTPCHWVAPFLCSACRDEGIRLYEIATGRRAA